MELILGDCLEVLKTLPDNSVDSVVTDPPYGIGFMNKEWDNPAKHRELIEREKKRSEERFEDGKSPAKGGFSKGVQPGLPIGTAREGKWFQEWCEEWGKECLRVLKPGGYLLSFSAPRTYHRMTTGFEDAGFEIRDQIMWVFGSGFPKSLNIGKAVDKLLGNDREELGTNPNHRSKTDEKDANSNSMLGQPHTGDGSITKGQSEWEGWGTALKPAHEPICVARKPLSEKTNAENVLKWGTGGINIDESRIGNESVPQKRHTGNTFSQSYNENGGAQYTNLEWEYNTGRWPANIMFDEEAGQILDEQSGISKGKVGMTQQSSPNNIYQDFNSKGDTKVNDGITDKGGASRYFYCPKASKKDRDSGTNELYLFEDKLIWEIEKLNQLLKDISVDTIIYPKDNEWNTILFGNNIMDQYHQGFKFTTSIILKMIIGLRTLNYYPHLNTKDYIVDVIKMIRENGLNLVDYVEQINLLKQNITNEKMEYLLGVVNVVLPTLLEINKKGKTGNFHSTVKPTELMLYLIKLVTPKGGTVLEPFMGSGSTGKACVRGGFDFIGIEKEEEYFKIAQARIENEC